MGTPPRFMVTLPVPHEATSRMARVLHEEGLLGDFVVPLNISPRLRTAAPVRLAGRFVSLDKWSQPIPAVSGAAFSELLTAATYRVLAGTKRGAGTGRLIALRSGRLDRAAVSRLRKHEHAALIVLQGRSEAAARAAVASGVALVHQANVDSWALDEFANQLVRSAPNEAVRCDARRELPRRGHIESANWSIANARCVLVESTRMARRVQAFARTDTPVVVLGQGVDASYFSPGEPSRAAGPLRVVQAGRVSYAKGVAVTNEAVRLAGDSVASCAMAGWDSNLVPQLVKDCTSVRFTGGLARPGVRALLRAADIFVLPTYADSMPRAVLEAMASGLPVITTRESGYEDLIRDGENGFFVPSGDAEAIAALLRRLAGDPGLRLRVGAAARETAEANDWDAFSERFRGALYSDVLPAVARTGGDGSPPD